MRLDPDMAELAAEGFTKVLDTESGDKALHHAANFDIHRHMHHRSGSSSSRRSSDDLKVGRKWWSSRSSRRSSRHQQQQPVVRFDEAPSSREGPKGMHQRRDRQQQQQAVPTPDETYEETGKARQTASSERERKCELLRDAKNDYVPPQIVEKQQRAETLKWSEESLYDDVSRAAMDAKKRQHVPPPR